MSEAAGLVKDGPDMRHWQRHLEALVTGLGNAVDRWIWLILAGVGNAVSNVQRDFFVSCLPTKIYHVLDNVLQGLAGGLFSFVSHGGDIAASGPMYVQQSGARSLVAARLRVSKQTAASTADNRLSTAFKGVCVDCQTLEWQEALFGHSGTETQDLNQKLKEEAKRQKLERNLESK